MSAFEKVQRDPLAISVAAAVASANEASQDAGLDPQTALITVSDEVPGAGTTWRVHYGPRDHLKWRGGDITVFVDKVSGEVTRVLRGQ